MRPSQSITARSLCADTSKAPTKRWHRKHLRRTGWFEEEQRVDAAKALGLGQAVVRAIGVLAHILGRRDRARGLRQHLQSLAVHARVGREAVCDVEEHDLAHRNGLARSVRHARRRTFARGLRLTRDLDAQDRRLRRIDGNRHGLRGSNPLDEIRRLGFVRRKSRRAHDEHGDRRDA